MLLSLALALAISDSPSLARQVVNRGPMNYDSQAMHVHKERVPDPDDPSKTVEATVSYFFNFRVHMEDEPDDYEVFRTVRVRPEAPARPFQMSQTRVGIEQNPDNRDEIDALARTLDDEGVPASFAPVFNQALQAMRRISVESVDPKMQTIDPNVGVRSGGWTVRTYGYDIFYTDLHIQLNKRVEIPGRSAVVSPVGGERVYDLYEYWIPVPLIDEKFYPDSTNETGSAYEMPSGIGYVKFTPEYANLTGIGHVTIPRLRLNEYAIGKSNFFGTISAESYVDRVFGGLPRDKSDILDLVKLSPRSVVDLMNATAGQGEDMNNIRVPGGMVPETMPNCGSELVLPQGTVWIPDTPGYQTTMNTTPLRFNFSFDASVDGGAPLFETARTHCLNKDLKEPELGVRYFPFMTNDDVLSGLADLTAASRFRGPWDQVRTWIYTDKVGFKDANERIFPPVSEGQYANGLFDVFKLGGLGKADLTNGKMFDPALLLASTAQDKAFSWLAMQVGETAGKAVRKWIAGMPEELRKMLQSPADDFEKAHAPRLFLSLLDSLDVDTRMGALTFLDKSKEAEASLKGKVGDFRASLFSSDAGEVELAKRVAARYGAAASPDIAFVLRKR